MSHQHSSNIVLVLFIFLLHLLASTVCATTFTFVNKCDHTVWPGLLGKPDLGATGFELKRGSTRSFHAPPAWSGRFWARTGCNFDDSGHGACATGDCGSGEINCNGNSATPPATLAEFTLGGGASPADYYDVSLVDGYNVPMLVDADGGAGACAATGCGADLNRRCPAELRVDGGGACKSACGAFGTAEYCCDGAYGSPAACRPSAYSEMFKAACPKAYSYAFDDATSTFTCTAADYTITFCPSSPSLKSLMDSGPGSSVEQAAVATTSWFANLATGSSARTTQPFAPSITAFFVALPFILFHLIIS